MMESRSQIGEVSRAVQRPGSPTRKHPPRPHLLWFLQTTGWGILLFLGLGLLIQHVIAVSQGPTDFCQDYIAAGRVMHGMPIYQPLRCWAGYVRIPTALEYDTHPPTSVFLFLPLSLLPLVPASLIWGFCSLAAYLVSGFLLLQALGWRSLRGLALFVAGSVLWQPFTIAETSQNFWEVLTLLLVLAWMLERRGRFGWAGGLLGLASLLKLWPAALLAGAIVRRRWRLTLVSLVTILAGLALTTLLLGPGAFVAYLGPVQANEGPWVPDGVNVSLVSAIVRPFAGYTDQAYVAAPLVRGVSLSRAILLGEAVTGLVLVGTVVFIWWCSRLSRTETATLLGQSLLLTVLLLVFPISWLWGMITILLPCAAIILALRQLPRLPFWQQVLMWGGLAPLLIRQSLMAGVAGWFERHVAVFTTAWLSLPTLGLVIFASMQAYLLWWTRRGSFTGSKDGCGCSDERRVSRAGPLRSWRDQWAQRGGDGPAQPVSQALCMGEIGPRHGKLCNVFLAAFEELSAEN